MRLTIEHCRMVAKERDGYCVSETYKNNSQKLVWMCSVGHEFMVSLANIKNRNVWCSKCRLTRQHIGSAQEAAYR